MFRNLVGHPMILLIFPLVGLLLLALAGYVIYRIGRGRGPRRAPGRAAPTRAGRVLTGS